MERLTEVPVAVLNPERFKNVIPAERYEAFAGAVATARKQFAGRAVWNINSTARGGGVAEMLRSLLAYARGAGIDARWLVIPGGPEFFRITKRIHNNLHGDPGDGGELGDAEADVYEQTLLQVLEDLARLVRPDDLVIVHDPQPAGLCKALKGIGAVVLWRCHVGLDKPNDVARSAWNFLKPHIEVADGFVFSRRAFVWEGLADDKITVIPPSIDAFSPKNQDLDPPTVSAVLATAHIEAGPSDALPSFLREDGTPARVDRHARMIQDEAVPQGAQLVAQVSRWDRLKDPIGVMRGFATGIAPHTDAHLVVAGPDVEAVSDDPEGTEVLRDCEDLWRDLEADTRRRVHLACLPMEDGEENAAMVNALQRRATVVVQKSIAEGFGLTVAEAKWKGRPVVASRIGGIQDQIVDGVTGILIDDPRDLASYGRAVVELLNNPARADAIGAAARERVRDEFLGPRHLMQYAELFARLVASSA
ncbi:MAG: glycosyltransferase [Actinomycetota bacterium]